MEEIYANVEPAKCNDSRTSAKQTGPRRSEMSFYKAALVCLGLLSVFLLVGLVGLGVLYRDAVQGFAVDLSIIRPNLTEASNDALSALTEERDQLNASLTEMTEERDQLNASLIQMTEERDRLQTLSRQKKSCPAGWKQLNCDCYLLSTQYNTWEKARQDCRTKGADLVVIDSREEQKFLSTFKTSAWIGLSDIDEEGTWKWIDGTPLTLRYWASDQPDNWKEEDCAHMNTVDSQNNWNDMSCGSSLQWICEKMA